MVETIELVLVSCYPILKIVISNLAQIAFYTLAAFELPVATARSTSPRIQHGIRNASGL